MLRRPHLLIASMAATVLLAGCGSSESRNDPIQQVPEAGGLRGKVRLASEPRPSDFPAAKGRSLQQVADAVGGGGPEAVLATSVFVVGKNRLAFGVIDSEGQFVYGKTAVYVAQTPDARARGPYVAPADTLITAPPYRSKQAATETDPFAAVYAAEVPLNKAGSWSVLVVTQQQSKMLAAPAQINVVTPDQDRIPAVGETAPRVQTDTIASAKGDEEQVDTRIPPAPDLHQTSFADALGEKPVALLFSTPQLCQSRVCGPVTDIGLQTRAKYGERVEFIHQEVYVDNDPNKGLREPLRRFNLRTEPWLFVVDQRGTITARLEGSFGIKAFERAVETAL
jgi:hypothetical protein